MKTFIWLGLTLATAGCGGAGAPDATGIFDDSGTRTGVFLVQSEAEPNDNTGTANAVALPTPSSTDDFAWAEVNGSIHDQTDVVDLFSFTPARTRTFKIELCELDCRAGSDLQRVDVSIAYISLLDDAGIVLMTSQNNITDGNTLSIDANSGVLYYVEVMAENTSNATVSYTLYVEERIP